MENKIKSESLVYYGFKETSTGKYIYDSSEMGYSLNKRLVLLGSEDKAKQIAAAAGNLEVVKVKMIVIE